MKWVAKTPRKHVFYTKSTWKKVKNMGDTKSHPKANKMNKNIFDLIIISLSTHTSHSNMYNHTNVIDIHWTLDLRIVCKYQVWINP